MLLRVQLWATDWECKYYLHKSKGRDCHLAWPIYNAWEVKSKGEGKLELIPIRIWVFWVYSFAIQPFKIVLMIPRSCYQINPVFIELNTSFLFLFLLLPYNNDIIPFTPPSDQERISPYNINSISSRQVIRIEKNVNHRIISWSNTKFSELAS